MTDISLTEARVEDRALITAAVHRYCLLATEKADWAAMAVLYTPEATIRFPDGSEAAGPAEMERALPGALPNLLRHHPTAVDIRFQGPDRAEVITMIIAITDRASPDHWGSWRDEFVRQPDGRWRIAGRSIVVDGVAPGGWLAGAAQ